MKREYIIEPCTATSFFVKKGGNVIVEDMNGGQVADFFAEAAENGDEFLSTGVTIDVNRSIKLKKGDVIYSDRYRPMFTLVADDVGAHDILHPSCRREMYDFFYKDGTHSRGLVRLGKMDGDGIKLVVKWDSKKVRIEKAE